MKTNWVHSLFLIQKHITPGLTALAPRCGRPPETPVPQPTHGTHHTEQDTPTAAKGALLPPWPREVSDAQALSPGCALPHTPDNQLFPSSN